MATTNTAQSLQAALTSSTETATQLSSFLDPYTFGSMQNQSTALSADNITTIAATVAVSATGVDIAGITNLIDCVRNIEDRLIAKLQEKLIELLLANPQASQILAVAAAAAAFVSAITQLIDIIKRVKGEDLLTALLMAKAMQGLQRAQKINEILNKFGSTVNNLVDMIENLDVLDICSVPNVSASGVLMGSSSNIPGGPPSQAPILGPTANVNSDMNNIKDQYDAVMFRLKESTGKNPEKSTEPGYDSMITSVNTIVLAYHDKVLRSTSVTDDPGLYDQYQKSIEVERNTHGSTWSEATKADYAERCASAGNVISNNTSIIRNYGLRSYSGPISGTLLSTGITWYSGPQRDFTTYLDLRADERPPEITAYWKGKGYNTEQRFGPLSYSDTTHGALGDVLVPDVTCASTRVPIDSILSLKKSDGTPYDPTGTNPQGLVRVIDTGSLPNTYNKPDIYTLKPEMYKGMDSVQVYVVSLGNRTSLQYRKAQQLYGGNPV